MSSQAHNQQFSTEPKLLEQCITLRVMPRKKCQNKMVPILKNKYNIIISLSWCSSLAWFQPLSDVILREVEKFSNVLALKVVTFKKLWNISTNCQLSVAGVQKNIVWDTSLHIHWYAKYRSHFADHMWSGPHMLIPGTQVDRASAYTLPSIYTFVVYTQ